MCFGQLALSELGFGTFATAHSFHPEWLIKKSLLNKYGAIRVKKSSSESNFYLFL